jgi:antitoxin MazE
LGNFKSTLYILSIYIDANGVFMPKAQLAKWGNSLAVRIPKDLAEQARLQEGDPIVIVAFEGHIELRPAERIPTLEELVAQITPENRYEETDWGPDVGREIVKW